jgi:3-oxoacyl-[acyl-carrier protein] reductase
LRNKEASERLIAEIKSSKDTEQHIGGDAIAIQVDVRDAGQVQHIVEQATRQYGKIDILVNNANAGRYELKAFLETTWQDFLERYSDEMKAAYEVTRAVLPGMLKRQYGKLIYITIGSARDTMPAGVMTFAIAKSSLVTFSRYLA